MGMFDFTKKRDSGFIDARGKGSSSVVVDFEPVRTRVVVKSNPVDLSSLSCNPGLQDVVDYTVERIQHRKYRILFMWDVVGQKKIEWSASE